MDAAADGTLTADRITDLIAEAARAQSIATYTGELRQRTERLFVGAFYEALQSGAADKLLDSLRPQFDQAAEAIAQARDLIPVEAPAEQFLRTASPTALTTWQKLDGHLAKLAAIGAIAAQFGCRNAQFPLIEEYALAETFRLDDRAIFCTAGDLEADSYPYLQCAYRDDDPNRCWRCHVSRKPEVAVCPKCGAAETDRPHR